MSKNVGALERSLAHACPGVNCGAEALPSSGGSARGRSVTEMSSLGSSVSMLQHTRTTCAINEATCHTPPLGKLRSPRCICEPLASEIKPSGRSAVPRVGVVSKADCMSTGCTRSLGGRSREATGYLRRVTSAAIHERRRMVRSTTAQVTFRGRVRQSGRCWSNTSAQSLEISI